MLLFVAAMAARRLLRPAAPTGEKLTTYECGVDPVGEGWAQTHVRYFVYAFLYVDLRGRRGLPVPVGHGVRRADLGRGLAGRDGASSSASCSSASLLRRRRGLLRWV